MSQYPRLFSSDQEPGSLDSIRPRNDQPEFDRTKSLVRNRKFRTAWMVSVFLHVVLFASALWSPSSAKYRFYGSGTAVSLVGADEIPGGSARGKSGDRPQDLVKPDSSQGSKAKKVPIKKKEKIPEAKPKEVKKKIAERKIPKVKPKKSEKKKPIKKIAIKKKKPKKKKLSKKRIAKLRRLKERRDREKKWRRKWEKQKKSPVVTAKNKPDAGIKNRGAGKDALAKTVEPPRRKSLRGYPGEGGGDGQGGGSLGGGSGGVARTDIDRYYGLLAERIRNYWTVPPNLTQISKLKTVIVLDVGRDGTIRGLKILKSSSNRVYDSAALRAVQRAAAPSFPPPPNTVKENWLPLGFRFCGPNFCRN